MFINLFKLHHSVAEFTKVVKAGRGRVCIVITLLATLSFGPQ